MEYVVSAPGKVIICGEHAVVYGKTAIASSVGLRTFLRVVPRDDGKVIIDLPDIDLHGEWLHTDLSDLSSKHEDIKNPPEIKKPVDPALRESLCKAAQFEGNSRGLAKIAFIFLYMALNQQKHPNGLHAFVTSELPIGAGLGSSAAFSVCLATALLLWHGHIEEEDLNDGLTRKNFTDLANSWGYRAEKLIHGNPSGIDNCVATYGGAISYVGGEMNNLKSFPPLKFLLTNTKVPRNTIDLVSGVRIRKEKYPTVMDPLLNSIHSISERVATIFDELAKLEEKDITENLDEIANLEDLIGVNHHLLNAIGVGHPALDEVCKITGKFNLKSKLTGAGGGGCALTFVKPGTQPEKLQEVLHSLQSAGFECFQTSIGVEGVCIHENFGLQTTSVTSKKFSQQPVKLRLNTKKRSTEADH